MNFSFISLGNDELPKIGGLINMKFKENMSSELPSVCFWDITDKSVLIPVKNTYELKY